MMGDNEDKTIKYITLTAMRGIGSVAADLIIDMCGSIEKCFLLSDEDIVKMADRHKISKSYIHTFLGQRTDVSLYKNAQCILDTAKRNDISIITREDENYPKRFLGLKDMPPILYIKGCFHINEFAASVGIIGARRCTAQGKEKAIETAVNASDNGEAVVSGMAKGIDSYAHTAAIKSKGYTIAVLGNGADVCYPREHERLYEAIAANGCVLSEYPPGTTPRQYMFPRRNRLIAALSDKIYVIDAGKHSGTESTIESGKKYGREVIQVNYSATSYRACNCPVVR